MYWSRCQTNHVVKRFKSFIRTDFSASKLSNFFHWAFVTVSPYSVKGRKQTTVQLQNVLSPLSVKLKTN